MPAGKCGEQAELEDEQPPYPTRPTQLGNFDTRRYCRQSILSREGGKGLSLAVILSVRHRLLVDSTLWIS
jgi:hypothetical protein